MKNKGILRTLLLCALSAGAACIYFYLTHLRPILVLDSMTYDLGAVEPGQTVETSIRLRNIGRKVLIVESIQTSCSCTAVSLESSRIRPGKECSLKVRMQGKDKYGEMDGSITIQCNDTQHPVVNIALKAFVDPIFIIDPMTLDFGILRKDELPAERVVNIKPTTNRRTDSQLEIVTDTDFVFGRLSRQPNSDRYQLAVKLSGDAPGGPLQATIWVTISATGLTNKTFAIPISGKITTGVVAEPDMFYFGVIAFGEQRTVSARVHFLGTSHEHLEAVVIPPSLKDYISAQFNDSSDLAVTVKSNAPKGRLSAQLRITCQNDKTAILDVPIFGFVSGKDTPSP